MGRFDKYTPTGRIKKARKLEFQSIPYSESRKGRMAFPYFRLKSDTGPNGKGIMFDKINICTHPGITCAHCPVIKQLREENKND